MRRHTGPARRPGARGRSAGAVILCLLPALLSTSASADGDGATATGVEHVVLCWLRKPGDAEAAAEVIRVSEELRDIPGVLRLVAGRALQSDRPIVDDSFDVGVVMSFASPEALSAYLAHPEHTRRVRETLQPLCGRIRIHDIRY